MDNSARQSVAYRLSAALAVSASVLLASWLIGTYSTMGAVAVLALLVGVAVVVKPELGLLALVGSLAVGQLVRIPAFGSEGAVLPNDLLLPALAIGWLLRGLLNKRVGFPSSSLSWPYASMLVVFVMTFIGGTSQLPFLTGHERLVSALYVVRWLEYALLLFIVADIVRTERMARRMVWCLVAAAVLLAVLGFAQLRVFPDFSFMVPKGWDPHVGRLLSTWFDPNFLGGFFAFMFVVVGGLAFSLRGRAQIVLGGVCALLFAALVLTFSRSSYAAFAAGVAVLAFLRSKRLFLLLAVVAGLVVATVPRIQERVQGALNIDATARLRIVSWQNALEVYRDHPLTGVGYNTYRFVQVDYGFQRDAAEHSAGGSDSSLLTILVTTGPLGLAAYLWILWASLLLAWSSFRRGRAPFTRGLGLGAVAGVTSVFVHSFFINSLLFPHTMETLALVLGVLVGLREGQEGAPV